MQFCRKTLTAIMQKQECLEVVDVGGSVWSLEWNCSLFRGSYRNFSFGGGGWGGGGGGGTSIWWLGKGIVVWSFLICIHD